MDFQAEMDKRINVFDAECNEITRQRGHMDFGKSLHHYTNDIGLRGILDGGTLWLSDITKLNDPSEIRHGMGFAIDKVKALVPKKIHNDVAEMFVEVLANPPKPFFVCSFSSSEDDRSSEDDLGQWRAYANDGCGYALEFDTGSLYSAFSRSWRRGASTISKIKYDDSDCRVWQNRIVDAAIKKLTGLNGQNHDLVEEFLNNLGSKLTLECLIVASGYKHEAYALENEDRFCFIPPIDEVHVGEKIRHRSHELIKYHEFPWKSLAPDALTRIWIGPAMDAARGEQYVRDCLKAYHPGYEVAIKPSEIPYRSMRS